MASQLDVDVGSVISGTMRTQDLAPAFLDLLTDVPPHARSKAFDEGLFVILGRVTEACVLGDDAEYWQSDTCSWDMDWMYDALSDLAPDGCYFGAHPGDGADYGFWPCEEV